MEKRLDFKYKKELAFNEVQWLEIEVMPPIDIDKIMDLISYLERLPEVKSMDVFEHSQSNRPESLCEQNLWH